MSDFTSRIDNLLTIRGIKRADLCRALNIPESSYRQWIKGSTPCANTALKIANYFDVSYDYLIDGKATKVGECITLSDTENELIDIYRSLDQRGRGNLLDIAKALEPKE